MCEYELGQKITFLRSVRADELKHSGRNLLQHLLGTYELLKSWGARQSLCDAGLFHSVYGTEKYSFTAAPQSIREKIRELIGEQAEMLAFLFGAMERQSFNEMLMRPRTEMCVRLRLTREDYILSKQEVTDLCNIVFANWLEQRPRIPAKYQYIACKELKAMRPYLLEKAVEQLNITCKPF